jgi:hypothetical protein
MTIEHRPPRVPSGDDERLDRLIRAIAPETDPGPELDDILNRMAAGIAGSWRRTRWVAPLAARC